MIILYAWIILKDPNRRREFACKQGNRRETNAMLLSAVTTSSSLVRGIDWIQHRHVLQFRNLRMAKIVFSNLCTEERFWKDASSAAFASETFGLKAKPEKKVSVFKLKRMLADGALVNKPVLVVVFFSTIIILSLQSYEELLGVRGWGLKSYPL